MHPLPEHDTENVLGLRLAEMDVILGRMPAVLRHLMEDGHDVLLSEEIVARVRGMLGDLAHQALIAQGEAAGAEDVHAYAHHRSSGLEMSLADDPGILKYLHALAVEAQLCLSLYERDALDPVLSPLLEGLIGSDDPDQSAIAMAALAQQARFVQNQGQMELPIMELPEAQFHSLLAVLQSTAEEGQAFAVEHAVAGLRSGYAEDRTRTGLFSRIISGMGENASAALLLRQAGLAIFLSALSAASGQSREIISLSTAERCRLRLALALRAARLPWHAVVDQLLALHPDGAVPTGLDQLDADRAAALLSTAWGSEG